MKLLLSLFIFTLITASLSYADTAQIQLINKFSCLLDTTCQIDKPNSNSVALEILRVSNNKIGFENLIYELKQTFLLIPNNDRDYKTAEQLQVDLQSAIRFNNRLLKRQQITTIGGGLAAQLTLLLSFSKLTKPYLLLAFIGGSTAGHFIFKPTAQDHLPEDEINFF